MAQNIGKKRGKSSIKTRLEQERKAGRKDPEGKKRFQKGVARASLAIPGGAAVKAGTKAVKAAKAGVKKLKDYNKGLAESNRMAKVKLGYKDQVRAIDEGVPIDKSSGVLRRLKPSKEELKLRSLPKNIKEFKKNYGAESLTKRSLERAVKKQEKAEKKADIARKKKKLKRIAKAQDRVRKRDAIERAETKLDAMSDGNAKMTLSMKKAILKDLKKGKSRNSFKAGGIVKKTKSHRGDGICKRGRTKGRMV